jgi:hypothetical protein
MPMIPEDGSRHACGSPCRCHFGTHVFGLLLRVRRAARERCRRLSCSYALMDISGAASMSRCLMMRASRRKRAPSVQASGGGESTWFRCLPCECAPKPLCEVLEYAATQQIRDEATGRMHCFPSNQTLLLIYTSGTTGKPKGVVHIRMRDCLSRQRRTSRWPLTSRRRHPDVGHRHGLVDGPVDGVRRLDARRLPSCCAKARLTIPDSGAACGASCSATSVTHLGLSPTLVRMLMGSHESLPPPGALDTLKVFGSTGETWNETPWLWLFETDRQEHAAPSSIIPVAPKSAAEFWRPSGLAPDGVRIQRSDSRHGRRRSRCRWQSGPRHGRGTGVAPALARHGAWVLERQRALRRNLLVDLAGYLAAW